MKYSTAILYSCCAVTVLAIGLTVVLGLFRKNAFDLIEEYENVTEIWKNNRIQYCANCTNEPSIFSSSPYCQNGRNSCYREKAESQASLLDYNHLLRKSSHYFQEYIDDYQFTTYGSGETVITEKVAQLKSYPESWIQITALGLFFAGFQFTLIILLAIATIWNPKLENTRIKKCWMSAFSTWFLLSVTLFIWALVQKIDYLCPGLAYQSKYCGSSSKHDEARTYGQAVAGFLGADMIVCGIVTCFFVREYSRTNKDY